MQKRVAMSTAESEYRAAAEVTRELIWLRRMLRELGIKQESPSEIKEDNQACIKMVENPMISLRNKHIEMDCHFIRDHHELGNICMTYIQTALQTADLMTKNLTGPLFHTHTRKILSGPVVSEGDCRILAA